MLLAGQSKGVREQCAPFEIGVEDLDRAAVPRGDDVTGRIAAGPGMFSANGR
jgi:hypothetical protein